MKYFVKFFVVTFLFLISTHATAEQKIVYLDMKFILNNSKAGKDAQDFLKNTFTENQKKFSEKENVLKQEEADLIAKNTILSKDEYKKLSDKLREKVAKYQAERRVSLEEITKKRAEARNKLLKSIDPILNDYITNNDISLVIDKKYMLGGKPENDITEIIVEKLNKELPSLNLK